jgi:uncharacterized protein (UPF0335 family)
MGEAMTNGIAREQLRSGIERIERLEVEKQEIADEIKSVKQEMKSQGFNPSAINRALKRRKKAPHDLAEEDALDDLYWSALGMIPTPPLFREVGIAGKDGLAESELIERMLKIVPIGGSIVVKIGSMNKRFTRDESGQARAEDVADAPAASAPQPAGNPPRQHEPVPDCTEDEAESLGESAAQNNTPVIRNPFPHDDPRRPRWDKGWRRGANSDGMGED